MTTPVTHLECALYGERFDATVGCLEALEMLLARGDIQRHGRIVIFNTGAAQKFPEAVHESIALIDLRSPIDWLRI